MNERETLETEVISAFFTTYLSHCSQTVTELLIHSYFNIVKREMIDMVPKAITLTLVNHSKENLQRELLQELYKPEVLEDLLKESELVVARRKEVVGMVQALNKAEECVLFLFPCFMLPCVWIGNNSLFTGLWRVSEGGFPIPFVVHVFVLSTHLYITPCLTASTLIIPVLDLDIFFPSAPSFLRVIASDE